MEFLNALPLILLAIFSMVSIITVAGFKYSYKISIIITTIFMIVLGVINLLIFHFDKGIKDDMYLFSIFLPEAILMFFLGKKRGISFIVSALNTYIALYLTIVTKRIICSKWKYLWLEYITYIITFGGVFAYLRILYKKLHNEIEYYTSKYMPLFGACGLVIFAIINVYRIFIKNSQSVYILRLDMFAFAVIAAYGLCVFFFYFIFKQFKNALIQASDNQILEQQIERINMANVVREEKEKELRVLRHDIKHILSTTSSLIKSNKTDDAIKFIEQYISVSDTYTEEIYCKDPIINSVIGYYKKKCDSNEILFNLKINNFEEALKISCYEVAILIANCLDNAYNATSKLKRNKFIEFTFLNNDDRLVLQVKNSYDGKIILDANKKPTNLEFNHGLGTTSIERISSKYNLLLNYEIDENTFTISILFKAD